MQPRVADFAERSLEPGERPSLTASCNPGLQTSLSEVWSPEIRGWFRRASESDILELMTVSRRLLELATKQGGYLRRDQLVSEGLSTSAIDRRVNGGEFVVVGSGVYQVLPTTGHLDLLRGAMLTLPSPVVSHQSAAFLLDFPNMPNAEPTVTVASNTTHSFPGVTVRRNDDLQPSHLTKVSGLKTTNVARTVFDLGGILEFAEFESMAEALMLDGRLKERHLERLIDELARKGKPGSRAARDFLELRAGAHPGSTALERRGREVLTTAGLPLPVPQYRIPWETGRRFDDAYPDARVAIEWDSRSWHEQRAAMASDRLRDRTAARHRWYVIRFTWADVTEKPDEVVSTVGHLLRERLAS